MGISSVDVSFQNSSNYTRGSAVHVTLKVIDDENEPPSPTVVFEASSSDSDRELKLSNVLNVKDIPSRHSNISKYSFVTALDFLDDDRSNRDVDTAELEMIDDVFGPPSTMVMWTPSGCGRSQSLANAQAAVSDNSMDTCVSPPTIVSSAARASPTADATRPFTRGLEVVDDGEEPVSPGLFDLSGIYTDDKVMMSPETIVNDDEEAPMPFEGEFLDKTPPAKRFELETLVDDPGPPSDQSMFSEEPIQTLSQPSAQSLPSNRNHRRASAPASFPVARNDVGEGEVIDPLEATLVQSVEGTLIANDEVVTATRVPKSYIRGLLIASLVTAATAGAAFIGSFVAAEERTTFRLLFDDSVAKVADGFVKNFAANQASSCKTFYHYRIHAV